MNETKQRIIYYDILRIVAIFGVLFNHTGARGYTLYQTCDSSWLQLLEMTVTVFCKMGVYIFFMISGALLLKREQEETKKEISRFVRIAAALLLGSGGIYLYNVFAGNIPLNPVDFLLKIYQGNLATSYWYLYAYLEFLLLLPFLRILAHKLSDRQFVYLFVLYLVFFDVISLCNLLVEGGCALSMPPVLEKAVFFPLLGYYADCRFKVGRKHLKYLTCAGLTGFLVNIVLMYWKHTVSGEWGSDPFLFFIEIWSVTLFLTVKRMTTDMKISPGFSRLIAALGKSTFGIYLFEFFLKKIVDLVFLRIHIQWQNRLIDTVVYLVILFAFGAGAVTALSKLPILKKIL
ncbi:MAG: acyltransferase [Lachnospiraceae bacterium]|jgi:surface polysaccharide O-acyltransferase-like enzyme|nr:acyltransferase [Lachnospiraceae bacterium]